MSLATQKGKVFDYVIVGAGCAGLYCAWRLLNSSIASTQRICILEKDNRVGGRLLSQNVLTQGRKAELGGMRFTKRQVLINALIDGLSVDPKLPKNLRCALGRDPFSFETKLMYLRAQRFLSSNRNWSKHISRIYRFRNIKTSGMGDMPVLFVKKAIRKALNNIDQRAAADPVVKLVKKSLNNHPGTNAMEIEEWNCAMENVRLKEINRDLREVGFWNLLQHYLKVQEFLFVHDSLGYESLLANSNAAQALRMFLADFDKPNYSTLQGGMETLPRVLQRACMQHAPRYSMFLNRQVNKIALEKTRDGLCFALDIQCSVDVSAKERLPEKPLFARNVILAVPKKAMTDIRFEDFKDKNDMQAFIANRESVTPHPAFKQFLLYKDPWWYRDLQCLDARATTDLPIRQIFYIGDSERGNNHNRKPRRAEMGLIMAGYSDEHYVDFWDPLVKDPEHNPKPGSYDASDRIKHKAHHQLELIHGRDIQDPIKGWVKEWEEAWHFWNVHTKPWKTAGDLVRPFKKLALFTCGEAYSLEQGWVEGALKSAERVLQEIISGPPPLVGKSMDSKKFKSYISN